MCKTKECGHCGEFYNGRRDDSVYCSKGCSISASNKRHKDRKDDAKYAPVHGKDWKDRITSGQFQMCKKCDKIKEISGFARRTKSGVSICKGCGDKKYYQGTEEQKRKARRIWARDKLSSFIASGKNYTEIKYIDCSCCGIKEIKRPKRKYLQEGMCYKCGRKRECECCKNLFIPQRVKNDLNKFCSKRCLGIGRRSIDYNKGVKTCTSCLKEKDIKEFHKCGIYRDGSINYGSGCKRCEAHKTYNKYNDPGLPFPTPTLPFDYDYRHKRIQVIKKRFKVVKYRHDNIGEVCCLECSATFRSRLEDNRLRAYCSGCSNRAKLADIRHSEYESTPDCIHCNKPYYREYGSMTTRCNPCAISAKRASSAAARTRRRTAMLTGSYMNVDPIKVFKRDKWKCKMCNVKTQKRNIYADDAAELDHIVPLSKGGNHIPSNLQCLCRRCNAIKSDRLIGQASLFSVPMSG